MFSAKQVRAHRRSHSVLVSSALSPKQYTFTTTSLSIYFLFFHLIDRVGLSIHHQLVLSVSVFLSSFLPLPLSLSLPFFLLSMLSPSIVSLYTFALNRRARVRAHTHTDLVRCTPRRLDRGVPSDDGKRRTAAFAKRRRDNGRLPVPHRCAKALQDGQRRPQATPFESRQCDGENGALRQRARTQASAARTPARTAHRQTPAQRRQAMCTKALLLESSGHLRHRIGGRVASSSSVMSFVGSLRNVLLRILWTREALLYTTTSTTSVYR